MSVLGAYVSALGSALDSCACACHDDYPTRGNYDTVANFLD